MEEMFDTSKCVPAYCEDALKPELLANLVDLQILSRFKLRISSAFRSPDHEHSRGRDGSSSHCKGLAVDILCKDNLERFCLVDNALRLGFPRIGIAKTFIHLDMDCDKPHPRIWLYD